MSKVAGNNILVAFVAFSQQMVLTISFKLISWIDLYNTHSFAQVAIPLLYLEEEMQKFTYFLTKEIILLSRYLAKTK